MAVVVHLPEAVSPEKAQVPTTAEAFLQNTDGATEKSPDAAMDAVISQVPAPLGLLIVLVRLAAVRSAKQ